MPDHENQLPALRGKQGINIAGDTVTLNTADYPEEQRNLIRWAYAFAKENDWSWDELASNLKVSTTTFYRIWHGDYKNPATGQAVDVSGICEKIERFKRLAEERAYTRRMPFVETSVFRRVEKLCKEALIMQTIACIYGESQIGKTESLKEVKRRNNHGQTKYVLMPASAGVQSMMKAIAEACNISVNTSFEALRGRVANHLDDSMLLIIDEVHECFVSYQKTSMVKCLSVLRQLQETTQCGLVLCGTNVFRTEMEKGEFSQSLKQLRKRGIWELQLESTPTQADLALIAQHYKLGQPTDEAAELVKWIAKEMGLGKYTKFMARAAQLAAKKEERFTWDHFVKTVAIATKLKQEEK